MSTRIISAIVSTVSNVQSRENDMSQSKMWTLTVDATAGCVMAVQSELGMPSSVSQGHYSEVSMSGTVDEAPEGLRLLEREFRACGYTVTID